MAKNGNREYKSDAFSMLMEDKRNALEVYNALNGTNYEDEELIEFVKLKQGVSLTIRNDASFIVDSSINFYEHQSTYNPNMPLRHLLYFTNHLEEWIKSTNKDIYGTKQIKIPTPHFVVLYNGERNRPEIEIMKLSQAFEKEKSNPQIELTCAVYNINPNFNNELKRKSKTIDGYCYFVERTRENHEAGYGVGNAVDLAIRDCIENHILEEFFRSRGDEVRKVTELDFTWERREELIRIEEREEGRAEGKAEGIINLMSNMNCSVDAAMDMLGISPEERELCKKYMNM